jgi:myo-inositol-1(or 4)-monophosphatase
MKHERAQFSTFQHEVEVAVGAAQAAGRLLIDGQKRARSSASEKGSLIDVVTEVDKAAEVTVVTHLSQSFPNDGIVGEEGTDTPSKTGRRWIIDPLDGTANFIRGWRMSAVSIGLEVAGEFTVGVVFNPLVDELFTAVQGEGARLNGISLAFDPITVAFEAAYVGMDGGYMTWARNQRAHVAARLIREAGEIRYGGSTALSLCHVAMGRLDAHVNIGSSLWDIAAGAVVAREAGLLVEGIEAGSSPTSHHTIAARPELLEPLQSLVAEAAGTFVTGGNPGDY